MSKYVSNLDRVLLYSAVYNYNSPLAGTGAFLQVLDPGVALLCVGEVLLALALEELPPGHLGAPGVSHPHPPPAVGAASRPVRPLKQHTVAVLCNFVLINVEVKSVSS